MKILIIGTGCVGTATMEGFKRLGHDVVFYDKNEERQKELIQQGYTLIEDRIYDYDAVEIVFVCVEEWNIEAVFEEWKTQFADHTTVVVRSTVPPGTCRRLSKKYGFPVFHNPEFLKEATALHDFMNPDKIIIGRDEGTPTALYNAYTGLRNIPIITVDTILSEFLKLSSNAILSSYISMWNQLKLIGDKLGVNTHELAKILTLDPRISKYGTIHGKRYGGFCLPKDLKTLTKVAQDNDVNFTMLDAIKTINEVMPESN